MENKISNPTRVPTPPQPEGPFYPVTKPQGEDADLTFIPGRQGKARGQIIYVTGQVMNLQGRPLSGVKVEIWQANTHGRYTHPEDTNPAPLDPNFEGYGVSTTDAGGNYRFKTVKPAGYRASGDWVRPPHIHFRITGKGNSLTTQLYFEGEPLNEKDSLLSNTENKEALITKLRAPTKDIEPEALIAPWDIVLTKEGR